MNDDPSAPMAEGKAQRVVRIGLVATDPLRILGLQQMFVEATAGQSEQREIVPLSVPGVLQDTTLMNVLIDASCTDHLLELLTTFRRMRPQLRLIVIGDSIEAEYIQRVIGAGARGYVTQTVSENEIRMALEMVNDGSVWAPRRVLARLLDAASQFGVSVAPEVDFTERERDVLRLLVRGFGNCEIAEELCIGESTVKAHLTRLMRKVRVKNRVELTLYALPRVATMHER